MYGCESWTIKKAEHRNTDVFELWCWRRLLRVPLDRKGIQPINPKGNQSWIFIGRTDAEAEAPIIWPPDVKNWLTGKDPDAGTDWRHEEKETNRGWDVWMASLTKWIWVWASFGSWWWTGRPGMLQSMGPQRVRHDWAAELNWTSKDYRSTTLLISEPAKGSDSGGKKGFHWAEYCLFPFFCGLIISHQNGEIETASQFSNWPLLQFNDHFSVFCICELKLLKPLISSSSLK